MHLQITHMTTFLKYYMFSPLLFVKYVLQSLKFVIGFLKYFVAIYALLNVASLKMACTS